MFIQSNWRVLTVGDGDLSFSYALKKKYPTLKLTATVYDSFAVLDAKYKTHFYHLLQKENVPILCGFDVTNEGCWSDIERNYFDLVIFQFPLLPGFSSEQDYQQAISQSKMGSKETIVNTLNRCLLREFLLNSGRYFLDSFGAQLCYITSKDVKPYQEWNIENSINQETDFHYLGSTIFDITEFPEYKVRNVDRDKYVRDTQGTTYVWSLKSDHLVKKNLEYLLFNGEDCCSICRAGPFESAQEKQTHIQGKKHRKMQLFEDAWQAEIMR